MKTAAGVERVGENLVLLQQGLDAEKHIFLVHAGSGEVGMYREMIARLQPEYNYWGIRASRISWELEPGLTIEKLATSYLQQIRQVQPHGPYRFISWCIGGTISFEIVRQLEALGEKVALLTMIDTMLPENRPLDQAVQPYAGIENILSACQELILDPGVKREELQRIIPINIQKSMPDVAYLTPAEIVYYLNLLYNMDRIRNQYVPAGSVQAPVQYVLASQLGARIDAAWVEYCQRPLRVQEIHGDHYSIFELPDLLELVRKVIRILREE